MSKTSNKNPRLLLGKFPLKIYAFGLCIVGKNPISSWENSPLKIHAFGFCIVGKISRKIPINFLDGENPSKNLRLLL